MDQTFGGGGRVFKFLGVHIPIYENCKVVLAIVETAEGLNLSDFFPMLARFDFQGVEHRMKTQVKKFDYIFETTIEERTNSKSKMSEETCYPKIFALVSYIIDQDIFLGGTDATSAMTEWAMTEILRNPKVMKKVQDELAEVVGLNNTVEESHLPELKYLDAVFKETFRLHTPLPFLLPRTPDKSCVVGGYTVPKGATVFLNVWAIQRDPQNWANPSEFNPERFLNNKGSEKWDYSGTNSTYFPFGSGRRRCPGIPLGEKMMMHILASLMHSFDWSLPKGEELDLSDKFGIAMKKKMPLVVIPSPRLSDLSLYS
ncbi:geraniol 8-hydroxylase-like protein [Tanacetum coccineum]